MQPDSLMDLTLDAGASKHRDLSFDVAYSHVKAHQDDHKLFADLIRQAQLNCIADWLAKRVLQTRA